MAFITLKARETGRVTVKNGSILVSAKPGQVIEVNQKQFDEAVASGHFKKSSQKAFDAQDPAQDPEFLTDDDGSDGSAPGENPTE